MHSDFEAACCTYAGRERCIMLLEFHDMVS